MPPSLPGAVREEQQPKNVIGRLPGPYTMTATLNRQQASGYCIRAADKKRQREAPLPNSTSALQFDAC